MEGLLEVIFGEYALSDNYEVVHLAARWPKVDKGTYKKLVELISGRVAAWE